MYDELPDLDDGWSHPESSNIGNTAVVNGIRPIEEANTIHFKSMLLCNKILGSPGAKYATSPHINRVHTLQFIFHYRRC